MINFDLLEKEEIAVLINCFETNTLLVPVKHPTKTLQRYIPNGFRPEKLSRSQLTKLYVDALSDGEQYLAMLVSIEVDKCFDEIGLNAYFRAKRSVSRQIPTCILEISNTVFEKQLELPAHIILALFGFQCAEEEKKLSQDIYDSFYSKNKEAKESGIEYGMKQGEEKYSNDLEAERRRSAKLEKNLDVMNRKNDEIASKLEQLSDENKKLCSELKKAMELAEMTKKEKAESEETVAQLIQKEKELEERIASLTEKIDDLNEKTEQCQEAAPTSLVPLDPKAVFSTESIKEICEEAIKMLDSDNSSRKEALDKARELFVNEEDVKQAWRLLCEKTTCIVEELHSLLLDGRTSVRTVDKFNELEGLLLLENTVQKALLSLTYKTLSSSAIAGASTPLYKVDEEEIEKDDE